MSNVSMSSAELGTLNELNRAAVGPSLKDEILYLHDEFRSRLLRYAVSLGLNPADAEDVVQETFLALFRHLLAERPRTNLPGWLFRVVHRLALKRRISYSANDYLPIDDDGTMCAAPMLSPEEQVLVNERYHRLQRIFLVLPEIDRLCLQLRSEGLKYREIANVLNISLGSVNNSLERSLNRLR